MANDTGYAVGEWRQVVADLMAPLAYGRLTEYLARDDAQNDALKKIIADHLADGEH